MADNKKEKWSISLYGEYYQGNFGTAEEAKAEAESYGWSKFFVAKLIPPIAPELLFDEDVVADWIERYVWDHDDYSGEWVADAMATTKSERQELADEIQPIIAAWLDRHGLRPTFFNIDDLSVREIENDG